MMLCTSTAVSRDISRQLQGPRGGEELHRLWITASTLTLWRARSCHCLLSNVRICFMMLFHLNHCSASECGSPDESLTVAVVPRESLFFARAVFFFCEITPIISLAPPNSFIQWSCASGDTEAPLPQHTLLPPSLDPHGCFDSDQL